VAVLKQATQLRAANEALFFVQPAVLALLVFAVHSAALGKQLTPSNVFVTLALLNITQVSITTATTAITTSTLFCFSWMLLPSPVLQSVSL
jgi:hypothetical protein